MTGIQLCPAPELEKAWNTSNLAFTLHPGTPPDPSSLSSPWSPIPTLAPHAHPGTPIFPTIHLGHPPPPSSLRIHVVQDYPLS